MAQKRAEREAEKNAERQARQALRDQKKHEAQMEAAERKAAEKGAAIAAAFCKKLEATICSVQKTMRLAGAANVPDVQKAPLRQVLAALEDSHQKVQVVSNGCGAVGYTVPAMEKTAFGRSEEAPSSFRGRGKDI